MKNNHVTNGFTLIEVIVSLLIIGVVAACFLPFLLGGYKGILSSGKRTGNLFEAQKTIDDTVMNDGSASGTDSSIKIIIKDDNGVKLMESPDIHGKIVSATVGDKEKVTLSTFIPND